MAREVIKKVLKESDWDWTQENQMDVPIKEIEDWVDNTKAEVWDWINKLREFDKNAPQMTWSGVEEFDDQNKMITLSIRGIGDDLRNIYASFESIKGEMDYIRNPEKYDE
jgi:hypothetical protein